MVIKKPSNFHKNLFTELASSSKTSSPRCTPEPCCVIFLLFCSFINKHTIPMVPKNWSLFKSEHKTFHNRRHSRRKGTSASSLVSRELVCLPIPAGRHKNTCQRHRFHIPHPISDKIHPSQGYLFISCARLPQSEPGTQCWVLHQTIHKTGDAQQTFRKLLLKTQHINKGE